MKKLFFIIFLIALINPALHAVVTLTYDKPITLELNKTHLEKAQDVSIKQSGDIEGYLINVYLPFSLGVGIEIYTINYDLSTQESFALETRMFNLSYTIPVTFLDFTLGAGAGATELVCNNALCSNQVINAGVTSNTEFFARLGANVYSFFGLHVGYHIITNQQLALTYQGAKDKINTGANMLTVGLNLQF